MPECIYCGATYSAERLEATGYQHCTKSSCVVAWRRLRVADSGLKLALMHKQGLMWMSDNDVKLNDMKRAGGR